MRGLRAARAELTDIATQPIAALLVIATTVAATVINVFVLPGGHLVSSLYAIPILIAGYRFQPRVSIVLTIAAVVLYLQSAWRLERPLTVWPFSMLGLVLVGVLTYSLAMRRREIAQRAAGLEVARQRLQEFIGMVSHDLAGALTTVMFSADILSTSDGHLDPESSRWATDGINDGTRQMRCLLNDLRDASAIGAGHFTVKRDPMDLVALASKIVQQQQALAPDHILLLDAPEMNAGAWDRERVSQLLTNLVTNAIKYSPSGSDVRVSIVEQGDHVLVGVSDNGPGIAPEQQAMLFEPFQRLDQDLHIGGTGLGLTITRAIVEAHGGDIWVDSTLGVGTTFFATLPSGTPANQPSGQRPAGDRLETSTTISIEPGQVMAAHAYGATASGVDWTSTRP